MVTSNKMGRALHDEILRRWKDKGLFASQTSVKSSQFTDASTFRSTLSGHQEGESSILLQILSGITLTVIPHAVDSKMDLRHSLKNAETGCVFVEALAPLPLDHVPDRERDLVLGDLAGSLHVER